MSNNEIMSTQIRLAYKDQLEGILTARVTSWEQLLDEEKNQIMNFYIDKYNKSGGKDGEHLAFPSEEEIHTFLNEHSIGNNVEIPEQEIVNVKDVNSALGRRVTFDKSVKKGGKRTRRKKRKRKKKRSKRKRRTKKKKKIRKNKSTKKMDKDFNPNLTPRQMFTMGSFGGTYWRPIKSKFHNTTLKNKHKKYSFLKGISDNLMTRPFEKYDVKLNKYKKKVGTTLKFWENKGWMRESHPYGWVQWYCDYYSGKRSADDERQIKRWKQLAGPNGRFRKWLVTQIMKKGGKSKWDDHSISPAIRQTLQHWGYKLTKKDFDRELENRKNK